MLEDTRQTGVYRIRCTATNRYYVGSASTSFKQRWAYHRKALKGGRHGNSRLQNAWNKYGPLYFVFEIVERTAPEHAVGQEQVFIDFWKSADPKVGYNILPTAGSPRGTKWTAEQRAAASRQRRGKLKTPEHRAAIGRAHLGKKRSPEALVRMRAAFSRPKSTETIAKIVAANRGRTASAETKAKMSARRKGRKLTPEHIAKLTTACIGRSLSPEARQRIAIARKGSKASDATRAKMSAAHKGRTCGPLSPETRAKVSSGLKAYFKRQRELQAATQQTTEATSGS